MTKACISRKIRVYGIVQGVGFRPTVDRHAHTAGINGNVINKGPYVEILAEGTSESVDKFLRLLREEPPKRAVILKIDVKDVKQQGFTEFQILESQKTKGEIFISPDIAICEECKEELYDSANKRYLHPFINCTCCGPRLTILDALPYDRERTSMKMFPMCPTCEKEYHNPNSRRYDAQPVCCPDCGPVVYLLEKGAGAEGISGTDWQRTIEGKAAIRKARETIASGGIVAVKGIGGFHLCCDATNEEAVAKLRERKSRPAKPFAVMMRDVDAVAKHCELSKDQSEILTGHQKPIILLRKRKENDLAQSVAPDNPTVGVMLPYAPVQLLLFDSRDDLEISDCLVMTSANISGAPIVRTDEDAVTQIANLCDVILSNNRTIRMRADDTVMDFYENTPYMIRRSRGYAPLPSLLSTGFEGQILAMGGELKNTFCIGTGNLFYPSSYIGDLADPRTVAALEESIDWMESLLEVTPQRIVMDLHPGYQSTILGERLAKERGIEAVKIQHHYAHVLSCMAENDDFSPALGVSFDGTGYGTDGTIWGGEILTSDLHGFERSASIVPFLETGGDTASREGWRIAVSMLYDLNDQDREKTLSQIEALRLVDEKTAGVQLVMHEKRLNSVVSTSAGRLFDAISAILGVRTASTFEGEASTTLMFRAEEFLRTESGVSDVLERLKDEAAEYMEQSIRQKEILAAYLEDSTESNRLLLPTDALVRQITEERLKGTDIRLLAYYFHNALADQITDVLCKLADVGIPRKAALTGGVFQNRLLLDFTRKGLKERGFEVLTHHLIPTNDGGICLGQAVYGMANRKE